MKDWAEAFYKSKSWQACRAAAWSRDRGLCQDCLKSGRITPAEIVHHITELTPQNIGNPSISLNLDNLVSVCRECHAKRHGARQRRYKVDELGRVTVTT
jgi:5-methylcytosine-specific restriction endonuclease McrA